MNYFNEIKTSFLTMSYIDMVLVAIVPIAIAYLSRGLVYLYKRHVKLKKQIKELEKNKCKGPHSWLNIKLFREETVVCQDCCFIPKYDTFVKKEYVNAKLKQIELEKKYEVFMDDLLLEIGKEYSVSKQDIKDIILKAHTGKQKFYVSHLEDVVKEMASENDEKK